MLLVDESLFLIYLVLYDVNLIDKFHDVFRFCDTHACTYNLIKALRKFAHFCNLLYAKIKWD